MCAFGDSYSRSYDGIAIACGSLHRLCCLCRHSTVHCPFQLGGPHRLRSQMAMGRPQPCPCLQHLTSPTEPPHLKCCDRPSCQVAVRKPRPCPCAQHPTPPALHPLNSLTWRAARGRPAKWLQLQAIPPYAQPPTPHTVHPATQAHLECCDRPSRHVAGLSSKPRLMHACTLRPGLSPSRCCSLRLGSGSALSRS